MLQITRLCSITRAQSAICDRVVRHVANDLRIKELNGAWLAVKPNPDQPIAFGVLITVYLGLVRVHSLGGVRSAWNRSSQRRVSVFPQPFVRARRQLPRR